MMTGTDGMRDAIGDAIDEDQRHLTGARPARSMPEMLGEVDWRQPTTSPRARTGVFADGDVRISRNPAIRSSDRDLVR
jgi:hypothetical protein